MASIFQKAYDAIKGWTAPLWLKTLLQSLNDIMIAILKEVGQQYINMLKAKIIEAAGHSDWSNKQKFDYVFNAAKSGMVEFSITIKDREIAVLTEFLVNQLKKSGVIV